MLTFVRRFLLIVTLCFWQGGFVFYGAVVVPVGSDVLGSHQAQGWVTREVSNYLNLAGIAALLVWGWDIAMDSATGRRWMRRGPWAFLSLTLGLQFWLHVRLDALLVPESFRVLDSLQFRVLHRWYLTISTIQWMASLILMAATLFSWRAGDGSVIDLEKTP